MSIRSSCRQLSERLYSLYANSSTVNTVQTSGDYCCLLLFPDSWLYDVDNHRQSIYYYNHRGDWTAVIGCLRNIGWHDDCKRIVLLSLFHSPKFEVTNASLWIREVQLVSSNLTNLPRDFHHLWHASALSSDLAVRASRCGAVSQNFFFWFPTVGCVMSSAPSRYVVLALTNITFLIKLRAT
jgi:hypothetical protein